MVEESTTTTTTTTTMTTRLKEIIEEHSMNDKTTELIERMTEWENLGQGVIMGRRAIVELDQRRQKCREALRQLRTQVKNAATVNKKSKSWLCLGNTVFIKVTAEKAMQIIEQDMKIIDETIEEAREGLKNRVDELKKMENSEDLEQLGFRLNPVV